MRAGRARHGAGPWCLAAAALAAVSSSPRWSRAWGLGLPGRAARPGGARARVRCRYEEPHDASDRWDIQSGGREVGFSKHKHLTYEEVLDQEPGFCNWVVQESQKEDASEMLTDFAQWLEEQGVSHFNDGLLGFSKHAHLTYEEALDQEPGFCNWVLRESQKEDASEMLTDFAQWLQEQGASDFNDGLVGFGKHAHLTYEEALDQEPGLCRWVLRESQKEDASGRLMDFAQWLQGQGFSSLNADDGLVGFGKHAHLTYEEALDQYPGDCSWVLRQSQTGDASGRLMDFAQWLQGQGFSSLNADDGLVGFGKHSHLTYEEALDQEPGYCSWVLEASQKEDASEMLTDFAQWLQEQGATAFADGLVGFARHAHLTYEEALDQEPSFCDWVLRESQKEDASERLMVFAQWLQEQGFSSMSADDGQEQGFSSLNADDGLVGFGKLAHFTYEEALDKAPPFCDWVLRESQKEDASVRLMVFAQWLKERGVEIEHSEGGKNLARQDEALPALRVHGDGGGDDEERSGAPDVQALAKPKKAKAKANAKAKAKPKKEKASRKAQDKQQTEAKAKGGIEEPAETVLSGAESEGEHAEQQQSKPKKAKASKAKASKASKAKKQKKESEPESQS